MAGVGKVDSNERLYEDMLEAQKKSSNVGSSDLTMDDYMSLIVAEMRSQDVLNPNTDTSAMVNQLVSMNTINAMDSLVSSANLQYSASLVGKNVTIAAYDANGKYYQSEGVVESAIMAGDEPEFIINGKKYNLSNIMEVQDTSGTTATDDKAENKTTEETKTPSEN